MNLFVYDNVNREVNLNTPECLLIKEFKALLEVNRNKCKEDPTGNLKLRAFREFTFIYLMLDWQSPYSQYLEGERKEACIQDAELTDEEYNDPLFREACRKYRELQESARDIKLIKAALNKVDELTDYFMNGSDLTERDPLTGKPIFKAKDVIAEMTNVSKVIDELEALEARVKKKTQVATGLRAGAEDGYLPKL